MAAPLPPLIGKARNLLIEALKLLDLHGTMSVRKVETLKGTSYVFRIEIPMPEPVSERERKRDARLRRG